VVVEHLVAALNILCQAVAMDCRTQVCRLGEEVIGPLLFMWNHRASEKLKVREGEGGGGRGRE
jgi:hypothetical protein